MKQNDSTIAINVPLGTLTLTATEVDQILTEHKYLQELVMYLINPDYYIKCSDCEMIFNEEPTKAQIAEALTKLYASNGWNGAWIKKLLQDYEKGK